MRWGRLALTMVLLCWCAGCSTSPAQPERLDVPARPALQVDEGAIGLRDIEPKSDVAVLTRAARHVLFPDTDSLPADTELPRARRTAASSQVPPPEPARAPKSTVDRGTAVWRKLCLGACLSDEEWRFVDAHPVPPEWAARCTPLK